ncbi:hypothetical protein DL96DRAFT_1583483 [Flagelloscypha sp. PMI_526]|nr:hypothetical protein DL96DRAFT_1583483 [Flagelloscypha sp. PMI_526]
MARTKADAHRDTTGNYVSPSGSELGTEDEHESYQLDLTQVIPPLSASTLPSDAENAAHDESIVSENLLVDDLPCRNLQQLADGMLVDPPADDQIRISQDVDGPVPIPISPGAPLSPRGKKGFDGPLSSSPLNVAPSSPAKPPPSSQTPTQHEVTPNAEASSSKIAEDAPTAKKPRQKRPRSPSLPPPPTRPPMQTMRFEIPLGGPENYQVDVADEARKLGLLPAILETPAIIAGETAAEDEDSEIEAAVKRAEALAEEGAPKKRRKKGPDTYDTTDPFIDDSMLAQDERRYIAQTKQTGFYVSSGEVAIVKEFNTKKTGKPKSEDGHSPEKAAQKRKRFMPLNASALLSQPLPFSRDTTPNPEGNAGSAPNNPILIDDDLEYDPETGVGKKRKRYVTVGGPGTEQGGKKRKIIDEATFHPDLQKSLTKLKAEINKQDWSSKGKFPADLKPHLADVAIQAIKLNEYDDHFFNYMPVIFPYNKFTMTKLIKRTIFDQHIGLLNDRQSALLQELKRQADEGFPQAEQEHNRAVMLWEKRKERLTTGQNGDPSETNGVEGITTPAVPLPPAEDGDDPMDGGVVGEDGGQASQAQLKRDQNPPQKKYRLTEGMRYIIWELVLLSNEAVRLENEKNQLENSITTISEQAARKGLYQRIVSSFPDGWMSSGQISRDVSAIKKKLEKEQAEQTEQPAA